MKEAESQTGAETQGFKSSCGRRMGSGDRGEQEKGFVMELGHWAFRVFQLSYFSLLITKFDCSFSIMYYRLSNNCTILFCILLKSEAKQEYQAS